MNIENPSMEKITGGNFEESRHLPLERETSWKELNPEEIENIIDSQEEINEMEGDRIVQRPETISQLYQESRQAREKLTEAGIEFDKYKVLTGQISKVFKKEERNEAKQEYESAQEKYDQVQDKLLSRFLEKAQSRWVGKGREEDFQIFRNELIFKGFFMREQEKLARVKQEMLPEQEKKRLNGLFKKIGNSYAKLPKKYRWAFSAGIGTAVAFGFGGMAAPALLGYAGFRYGRAALASLSAAGIKRLGDSLEKTWLAKRGRGAREEKVKTSLIEQAEAIDGFEQMNKLLAEKRRERNTELAKLIKQQKYWQVGKLAATIGAGGGIAFCAGHFDMLGSEAEAAEMTERTYQSPFKVPEEGAAELRKAGIEVPSEAEEAGPRVKPLEETVGEARELEPGIEEEAKEIKMREVKSRSLEDMVAEARESEMEAAKVAPEAAKVEPFQIAEKVSIKRGDSIWSVAEKYLKGNGVYQELLENSDPDTAEALEAYNIDRIKDTIVAHPENYGLAKGVNLDKLTIEQLKEINWQKAFTDTFPEGRGLTTGLTDKQIESIIQNNDALKNFFAEHPNAPRTSENYEAILEGEGITGQPAGAPEEAEGMTKEASAEKKLSLNEKKALLEKAGVPPEDIAKLETEDIEGLTSEQINEIAEVQQKIDSLEEAGASPEDIAKLKTEDIKDLTQSQIEGIAGPAEITEGQLEGVRTNLMDAYGMTDGESKAISGETVDNLLKNTPEDLDNIRDRFNPDLNLKHDDSFDYGEYKKYCQLAKDIRAVGPKPEEMDMTIGEFMARKLSAGVEEAKKGAINIEL